MLSRKKNQRKKWLEEGIKKKNESRCWVWFNEEEREKKEGERKA